MDYFAPPFPYQQQFRRVIPLIPDRSQLCSIANHLPPYAVAQATTIVEAKPRLGKDEVNKLEREFKKNPKPSTQTKKALAEEMNVDLPRINNWFQNRRAKRKQQIKAKGEEAIQAPEALNYPTPTSPETLSHGNDLYSDDHQAISEPVVSTYKMSTDFTYSPEMMEFSSVAMESYGQTSLPFRNTCLMNHEALYLPNNTICSSNLPLDSGNSSTTGLSEYFSYEPPHKIDTKDLVITPLSPSSKPSTFSNLKNQKPIITSPSQAVSLTNKNMHLLNTMTSTSLMRSDTTLSASSNCCSSQSNEDYRKNTQGDNAISSNVIHDINPQVGKFEAPLYDPEFNQETLGPQPAPSNKTFVSRPPVNIALRRKKVQQRPAALTAHTLSNRQLAGPCTTSHVDGSHFSAKSPCELSMRRIVSAGGNRAVVSGRVQKHSFDVSQRSPINIGGFENVGTIMDYNFHNIYNPPPLTGISSICGSLAPPTPIDFNFGSQDSNGPITSPGDGSHNFLFNYNTTNCLISIDKSNQDLTMVENLQSLPLDQISSNHWPTPIDYHDKNSYCKINEEPSYTTINNQFSSRLQLNEQLPSDIKNQYATQGFIPSYSYDCTVGHTTMPCGTRSSLSKPEVEYSFNGSFSQEKPSNEVTGDRKICQFSHKIQSDFSET